MNSSKKIHFLAEAVYQYILKEGAVTLPEIHEVAAEGRVVIANAVKYLVDQGRITKWRLNPRLGATSAKVYSAPEVAQNYGERVCTFSQIAELREALHGDENATFSLKSQAAQSPEKQHFTNNSGSPYKESRARTREIDLDSRLIDDEAKKIKNFQAVQEGEIPLPELEPIFAQNEPSKASIQSQGVPAEKRQETAEKREECAEAVPLKKAKASAIPTWQELEKKTLQLAGQLKIEAETAKRVAERVWLRYGRTWVDAKGTKILHWVGFLRKSLLNETSETPDFAYTPSPEPQAPTQAAGQAYTTQHGGWKRPSYKKANSAKTKKTPWETFQAVNRNAVEHVYATRGAEAAEKLAYDLVNNPLF